VNIVVVGGGVMGRLWTGWLTAAGHNVTVIDASPDVVSELNEQGVRIRERDGSVRQMAARALAAVPLGAAPAEMVFFFVKSEHTAAAADRAAAAVGPGTAVVTLQNGFGNAEALAERFAPDQIVCGPTEQGGALATNGHVVHAHDGDTFVGPDLDGDEPGLASRVAAVLRDAGLKVEALASVKVPLWRKRVFTASVLPVAALTGLSAGDLLDPLVFPAVAALAVEALSEADAAGCHLDVVEELMRVKALLRAAPTARASMLQDIETGNATEIDAITGKLAEWAGARGAMAAVCAAVTALVHGRELAWRTQGRGA
jgi:2-dehydropantoate 2-reductase